MLRLAQHPDADAFVLRGGLRIRQLPPAMSRPVLDADLICDLPFDPGQMHKTLSSILSTPEVCDGVWFDVARLMLEPVWFDDRSLGLNLVVRGSARGVPAVLRIDLRFGYPLWPPPRHERFVGCAGQARVRMARPETQIARKMQVVASMGRWHWRPKDLADLAWMLGGPVDRHALGEALDATFPRGLQQAHGPFAASGWWGATAEQHWASFAASSGFDVSPSLSAVLGPVRRELACFVGS